MRSGACAAEVVQPVVVGAGDGGGELGLEPVGPDLLDRVEAEHEQAPRREQHGQVEPFGVHGLDLRRGVPAPRLGAGVDAVVLGAPAGLASARCRTGRTRPRRSTVWFFTRTRMSRGISVSPMGAAWAYAGSM